MADVRAAGTLAWGGCRAWGVLASLDPLWVQEMSEASGCCHFSVLHSTATHSPVLEGKTENTPGNSDSNKLSSRVRAIGL